MACRASSSLHEEYTAIDFGTNLHLIFFFFFNVDF